MKNKKHIIIFKKLITPNLVKKTYISFPLANPAPIIVANIKKVKV